VAISPPVHCDLDHGFVLTAAISLRDRETCAEYEWRLACPRHTDGMKLNSAKIEAIAGRARCSRPINTSRASDVSPGTIFDKSWRRGEIAAMAE
jgi:hypothetical protein